MALSAHCQDLLSCGIAGDDYIERDQMTVVEYEAKLIEMIDRMVEAGSSDELFASGYLRGHISLAAAQCERAGKIYKQDLKARVVQSLTEAFLAGELNDADQALVNRVWQQLYAGLESQ